MASRLNRLVVRWASLLLFVVFGSAHAAVTLQVNNGILTGASGIEVNGEIYDVTFADGTCAELFNGCDEPGDFLLNTVPLVSVASQALLDFVLVDGLEGAFDSMPNLTMGCGDLIACNVLIPLLVPEATGPSAYQVVNYVNMGVDEIAILLGFGANFDTSNLTKFTWAVWRPAAVVPEPGSLALVAAAGLALAALRRRGRSSPKRPSAGS